MVSGGPDAKPVPDVSGQTVAQATTNLNTVGFKTVLVADLDSPLPAGQVVVTDPPAGTSLSVDTAITLKVSNGKQFVMPTLVGLFYDDLLPQLQGLGFVGQLLRGPDVPGVSDRDRNRVVRQDPPPGTGVSSDRHHHRELRGIAGARPNRSRAAQPLGAKEFGRWASAAVPTISVLPATGAAAADHGTLGVAGSGVSSAPRSFGVANTPGPGSRPRGGDRQLRRHQ